MIPRLITALVLRLSDQRGQTLAEYCVVVMFVALVVIFAATTVGKSLSSMFHGDAGRL